ncbi:MAG: SCO family protein [Burkholderiales bacterium]|nr:SCO family protein [Burkholderiales bacterium]MDE1927941.1 SCO family protein [Burkholderiales bacterium]MDE2158242.1 SCO family protein [Burkholderiales bacterium]MDE2504190.1 SCO family protein [Burkholderiales bacterium]
MDRTRRRLLNAVAALGAAALAAGCGPSAPKQAHFNSIDISGAEYARALDLPDTDGHMRHLSDFKGKVTVVFFGYTQCPDVCPTTMLELAQVKKALGADGAKVQGVFVTIDPARDTPQVLKAYVRNFSPDFIALRGDDAQTAAAAKSFKVYYAKVPGATPQSYTMDHTAGSYVFDEEGRVRLFTRFGTGADKLKQDLQELLREG